MLADGGLTFSQQYINVHVVFRKILSRIFQWQLKPESIHKQKLHITLNTPNLTTSVGSREGEFFTFSLL